MVLPDRPALEHELLLAGLEQDYDWNMMLFENHK